MSAKRVLILLNTPLDDERLVREAWSRSSLRVCADGAADRLLDRLPSLVPDLIVGDLDSVTHHSLKHYRDQGVEVMNLSADQDSTDLDKCLSEASRRGCDSAVIVGKFSGFGGRLDHTFGIIQSLFLCQAPHGPFRDVVCVAADSTMQLLVPRPEGHTIEALEGSSCGLVPIAGPCRAVSTSGLQWDLGEGAEGLRFGGLVSTSNIAVRPQVHVKGDGPLLWTMAFELAGATPGA